MALNDLLDRGHVGVPVKDGGVAPPGSLRETGRRQRPGWREGFSRRGGVKGCDEGSGRKRRAFSMDRRYG